MFYYRGLGPWGPDLVKKYTTARFNSHSDGLLTEDESRLLTGSVRLVFSVCCVTTMFIHGISWLPFQLKIIRIIL